MIRTRTSRTVLAAVLALSGAGVALAQSKPVTADPIDSTTSSTISSSAMWSMTTSENGRTFKLESKDGKLAAEVDGKAVPADRLVQDDDTVRIKDEKGETIFETKVPTSNTMSITSSPFGSNSLLGSPRARSRSFGPGNHAFRVQVATPPVMIGVQLLDPDSSIRGHLGLKENEATMVSAVYEGLPAALAGLEPYDIIIAVGDKTAAPPAAVREALRTTEAGKSVTLKVIHRGQEKTVTITPEKYNGEKLDKAKINAIAASSNTPNALAANIDPDSETWIRALGGGNNAQPFVATTPGKPMTIWVNPMDGSGGQSMNDFTKRMQEMAEQMRAQAEAARQDSARLHEQFLRQQQQGGAAPGVPGAPSGPGMDDRMKKMEEMLQKLMEQREKKSEDKSDSRSLWTLPARDMCTWRPASGSFRV